MSNSDPFKNIDNSIIRKILTTPVQDINVDEFIETTMQNEAEQQHISKVFKFINATTIISITGLTVAEIAPHTSKFITATVIPNDTVRQFHDLRNANAPTSAVRHAYRAAIKNVAAIIAAEKLR